MIEKIVLDYLLEQNFNAYLEIPASEPVRYVIIEKTGTSRQNRITTATVVVKSYAESLYEAANLNESVKTKMGGIIEKPNISRCKLETDYENSDKTKKKYRYYAQFSITHY